MNNSSLQFRTFILLLTGVTIAFCWMLWPYFGAVFWSTMLAIIFAPLHRRLLNRMRDRPNLAALTTLLLCLMVVIIPLILLSGSLVQQAAGIYKKIQSGEINLGAYFEQIMQALPPGVHDTLDRFGLADVFSLQEKLSAGALQGSKFIATQALSIGQNTFEFMIGLGLMLYLLFFLLRDGAQVARQMKQMIPLSEEHKQHLFRKFTTMVRAIIKGNVVVAVVQGALGGLIFWALGIEGVLLWSVMMAFLSLLPAVGAGLIWLPVSIYFLVTGAIWQGVTLILFGVLVIGLVDNLLRPTLVGKDTKVPDYIILITTLGGLAVFGVNGFVIGALIAALFLASWDLFPSAIRMRDEEE